MKCKKNLWGLILMLTVAALTCYVSSAKASDCVCASTVCLGDCWLPVASCIPSPTALSNDAGGEGDFSTVSGWCGVCEFIIPHAFCGPHKAIYDYGCFD